MQEIKLEYRFANEHLQSLNIVPNAKDIVQFPSWSYARHLSSDWDLSKIKTRANVATKLLENLNKITSINPKIDLTPLKNDQRISGTVSGSNPLQNMYTVLEAYAEQFPEQEFYGKWGGYQYNLSSKHFVFYVEDEVDADITKERLTKIAFELNIPIEAHHQYGLTKYHKFIYINNAFKSEVKNKTEFSNLLLELQGYPHFAHEFFLRK